jgi:hypothetical protein
MQLFSLENTTDEARSAELPDRQPGGHRMKREFLSQKSSKNLSQDFPNYFAESTC